MVGVSTVTNSRSACTNNNQTSSTSRHGGQSPGQHLRLHRWRLQLRWFVHLVLHLVPSLQRRMEVTRPQPQVCSAICARREQTACQCIQDMGTDPSYPTKSLT